MIERHTDSRKENRDTENRDTESITLLPVSPKDENQARFNLENPNDTNTITLNISPATRIENHAQNHSTGNSYDSYYIIPISSSIYREGRTDIWACKNCNQTGDKWYMRRHNCRGQK